MKERRGEGSLEGELLYNAKRSMNRTREVTFDSARTSLSGSSRRSHLALWDLRNPIVPLDRNSCQARFNNSRCPPSITINLVSSARTTSLLPEGLRDSLDFRSPIALEALLSCPLALEPARSRGLPPEAAALGRDNLVGHG